MQSLWHNVSLSGQKTMKRINEKKTLESLEIKMHGLSKKKKKKKDILMYKKSISRKKKKMLASFEKTPCYSEK